MNVSWFEMAVVALIALGVIAMTLEFIVRSLC